MKGPRHRIKRSKRGEILALCDMPRCQNTCIEIAILPTGTVFGCSKHMKQLTMKAHPETGAKQKGQSA